MANVQHCKEWFDEGKEREQRGVRSLDTMEDSTDSAEYRSAIALLEQMATSGFSRTSPSGSSGADAENAQETPAARRNWQPDLRYRSLVEKLPAVTFMAALDQGLQELYVSPQIEKLLGFTQEEWLDNPILWFQQLHPDDRESWVKAFAETCAHGTHFRSEYRLLARDGRVVWVQGECQIVRDESTGAPLFLQGVAFDITHLKHAARVEEEKRAAESANSAKSEFLARMSHEIRTPLNGLVGMIDLLRGTEMSETQQRYANLAHDAADALLDVINDILDFSKIEAGKVEVEKLEFDLHKVVEDLTELLDPVAAKKGLVLSCCLHSDVPRCLIGDPNRIRQVLTNLVSNAIKFTAAGSVQIQISMAQAPAGAPADRAIILARVQDTGIGIPADRLDRLFKSFSQVDTSTTRKFGGTGLGLAISKRLVELMGGEIGIESAEGQGTTFWFTLDLGASTDPNREAPNHWVAEKLREVRVLAIESDPVHRQCLSDQFQGRVSSLSAVVLAEDALAAARTAAAEGQPFGIVLLPYRTSIGEQLMAILTADPSLKDAKFVAVTESNDGVAAETVERGGYVARLQRPLTQSRLLDVVAATTVKASIPDAVAQIARASQSPLKGLHLLVADDNEMNQFVASETLARAGITCDVVSDGIQAMLAAARKSYAAILMDCQMPEMDGLEASRRIREREAATAGLRRTPIIALTAEALAGDREKCLAAGMDGYVSKPINPKELFAALSALVTIEHAAPRVSNLIAASVGGGPAEAVDGNNQSDRPIDVQGLFIRSMRDVDFTARTLEKFGHRAVDDIGRLRSAVVAKDADTTTRLAHNLKAVATHVSAKALTALAAEIEEAGIKHDLAFIEQALIQLEQEAKRCAAYVPQAIAGLREHSKAEQ